MSTPQFSSEKIVPSEKDGWRLGTKEFLDSQKQYLKNNPEMDFYDGTVTLGFGSSETIMDKSLGYSVEDLEDTQYHSFFTNRVPPIQMNSELSAVRKLDVSISASSCVDERLLHHFYEGINKNDHD